MTRSPTRAIATFDGLADALMRNARRLARARAAERRAADARWRSPRLLWPDLIGDD